MAGSYADLYPDLYPADSNVFPSVQVQCQFTRGTWTDISSFVKNFDIIRPSTRLQGPLWEYQAATCSMLLDNCDGRFDPDNLAGPYISSTGLQEVVWVLGPGQSKTWTAPRNLAGTTIKAEAWGPGANGTAATFAGGTGPGGGGGEYAAENTYTVIPGNSYAVVCPAGNSGSQTTFDAAGPGVTAHAGSGVTGGTGSTNSIRNAGGAGGAAGTSAGGGGGSSGSAGAGGTAGTAGNSGGAGGVAPTGGYAGGYGAPSGLYRGQSGQGPGGGGGGGGTTISGTFPSGFRFSFSGGGMGTGGQIQLTYFVTVTIPAVVTQVLPGVPVEVTATWNSVTYPLFSGFADSWDETAVDYAGPYSEVTLAATDGFEILSNNVLPALVAPVGVGDDSGTLVSLILDWAGWPATKRLIDAGDSIQSGTSFGTYELNSDGAIALDGTDALSLLQLTADTEIGELYINASGNVVFRHRQAILTDTRSITPQGVFGDQPGTVQTAGTELAVATIGRANDNTTLANDIQITAAAYTGDPSPVLQEATDPISVYVYGGLRSYARTDLQLPDDPTAFQYANWVLYISKNSEDRFDTVTVDPLADPTDLYPQVLAREIGDRIQVWRTPAAVSARVTKDVFIRGIEHSFDATAGNAWLTTWTLQSAARYGSFMTLDSVTNGILDTDALTY